jgi:hypothetical protein
MNTESNTLEITAESVYALLSEDLVSYILHGLSEQTELDAIYREKYPDIIAIYNNTLDVINENIDTMSKKQLIEFHVQAVKNMLDHL